MKLRATRHAVTGAAVALVVAGLASGCAGQTVPGRARPADDLSPGAVAGLPVTEGPSGLRPGVPNAKLSVHGYAGTSMDRVAVDALSDIDAFWAKTLPQDFGKKFKPPRKLTSFDSRDSDVQVCGESSEGLENAFYCPSEDSVAWDRGALLPTLNSTFGPMAVVTVFAHEMGHAVQYRIGGVTDTTPTIVKEQQADCYAGAFVRWVAGGHAKHFRISTGDGLNEVLSTMMFIRDEVGTTEADPEAHGSSFDRVTAFQFGFTDGAVRCSKIDYDEIRHRVTELGFTQASEANNNVPVDDTTLTLLTQSLNAAFKQNAAAPPVLVPGSGSCVDGTGTPPTSFCPQDNTIAVDEQALNTLAALPSGNGPGPSEPGTSEVNPPPSGENPGPTGTSPGANPPPTGGSPGPAGASPPPTSAAKPGPVGPGLGDFAAFAEVASRYALAVQKSLGIPLDDKNAGLRTACLTGAWAGVIRHHTSTGPTEQLLLGPGDLDEAVAELLSPTSMIAADVHGNRVPAGFARVSSFQEGFLEGSRVCTSQFG